MREIALWFWTILLANVEHHCLFEVKGKLEALVVKKIAILFLLAWWVLHKLERVRVTMHVTLHGHLTS